jgi:hypothetical protein
VAVTGGNCAPTGDSADPSFIVMLVAVALAPIT